MIHPELISSAWNLPSIHAKATPTTGTIHQILLLSTNETTYVLRAYRYAQKDRSRIVAEHALSTYAHAQGLPAIAPIALPSGDTILEHEGRFYALYPCAHGQQIPREQVISPAIITAMGHCLGELHRILSAYPHEKVRRPSFAVDLASTFSKMEKIEAAIGEKACFDAFDHHILAMLSQRKTWLQAAHAVDVQGFSSLEHQVLHGDYQESNLFFERERVSAIIDWDQGCVAPRPWEILRTLQYVFNLDGPRCHLFLNAYREVFSVSFDELALTAHMYGWVQAQNLWAYSSFYLENNHRVRHLLTPRFTPFEDAWAEIASFLR